MNNGVKKIRLNLGMSPTEFARAIGRQPSAISNYESGIRNPDLSTAYAIVDLVKRYGRKAALEDIYLRPGTKHKNQPLSKS